ncbi:MAG: hypothetical protein R3C62_20000 [Chloroflexota bacterium]
MSRFCQQRPFAVVAIFFILLLSHFAHVKTIAAQMYQPTAVGSITIVNATVPAGGTGFFYYGGLGSFFLDDGQAHQDTSVAVGDIAMQQSVPAGWQLHISCVGGSTTLLADGVTIHLADGDAVVCTFTNSDVGGSITIYNMTNPAGGAGFFYFGSVGSFTLDDGQSHLADNLLPNDYTILQTIPAGWTLTVNCTGGDFTAQSEGVVVHLDANEAVVCTFSNSDVGGSITIVNATSPAGGTGFVYSGGLGGFSLADEQQMQQADLLPGAYSVVQQVPAGWLLEISCTGGDTMPVTNGVDIQLDANEAIVCTFTNTDVGGSITIVNASVPGGAVGFSYFGDFGVFTLDDGQSRVESDLYPGDFAISQGVAAPWVLAISCVGGSTTPLGGNGVTVHLAANEDVVCTFTNTDVGGSITIVNAASPDDGTTFAYFGDVGSFSLGNGGSKTAVNLYPGDYDIQQTIPPGWLLNIDCLGASTTPISEGVTVHLAANEAVVCHFSNTFIGGSITIHVETDPAGGTGFTFIGGLGTFVLDDGQSRTFSGLLPGDYAIFEQPPGSWQLETAVCDNGQDPRTGVDLATGDDWHCTFANIPGPSAVSLQTIHAAPAFTPPDSLAVWVLPLVFGSVIAFRPRRFK